MPGRWMSSVPGRLAHVVRGRGWGRIGRKQPIATEVSELEPNVGVRSVVSEQEQRQRRVQYHLGRGRRAREAGRFDSGVYEARRALAVNSHNPWALSLLAQCLVQRHEPDLHGARSALERARALDPSNGYFVRLLLDVLDLQGDERGRADVLEWAWWNGASVERWLPNGPRRPWAEDRPVPASPDRVRAVAAAPDESTRRERPRAVALGGRQPVPA
jgi:hypothetical protein